MTSASPPISSSSLASTFVSSLKRSTRPLAALLALALDHLLTSSPLRYQLWWRAVAKAAAIDCCSCRNHVRSRRPLRRRAAPVLRAALHCCLPWLLWAPFCPTRLVVVLECGLAWSCAVLCGRRARPRADGAASAMCPADTLSATRHGWSLLAGSCASGWANKKMQIRKKPSSGTCHSVEVSCARLTSASAPASHSGKNLCCAIIQRACPAVVEEDNARAMHGPCSLA